MRVKFLKLLLLPAILAYGGVAIAQQGLHIQNFKPGNTFVLNKDSVYMSMSNGSFNRVCLINTADKEWKYMNSTDYASYTGPIAMKNAQEGIMIYSGLNKVYKTNDGWQTVTEVPNVAGGYGLSQIGVTKAGYIGFERQLRDLYFSPDGVNWTLAFDAGSGAPQIMSSFENKVIYYGGGSTYPVSTDGGQTYSFNLQFNVNPVGNVREFKMLSQDSFIIATGSNIYSTNDGGANWVSHAMPGDILSIIIKNMREINVVTSSADYYYTNDGGATWQAKTQAPDKGIHNGFYIGDDLYLWPAYKSGDNGTTWTYFLPSSVHVVDGWDVSFNGPKGMIGRSGGRVGMSLDKGRSFDIDVKVSSSDIMAVKVLDNGDMLAGDRYGQAFYSTDGINWNQRNTNTFTFNATKFSTSANDNVIVMSRLGQPLISTDHGATFNVVSVGGGAHALSVKPNGDIMDAVAKLDASFQPIGWEIFKVDPSGTKTSLEVITTADESLSDIHMASDNVGYLLTYNNTTKENRIYKTTNGWAGGATVTTMAPVVAGKVNYLGKVKIQTFGIDTLMLVGDGNTYYHMSTNGGSSWTKIDIDALAPYPTQFPSIQRSHFFNSEEYIFTLNSSGVYLNTKEAAVVPPPTNGIETVNKNAVQDLIVCPNPSSASVKLSGIRSAVVNVCMYDMNGRIALMKSRHSMQDEVNVKDLPDGMYIISVRDNNGKTAITRFLKK